MSFRRPLVGTRYAASTIDRGIETAGAGSTINFTASIQPLSPNEMKNLPEGRREKEAIRLYTDFELRTVDVSTGTNPDQVTINGKQYEVVSVEPWQNGVINHYKVIVSLIG